MFTYYSTFLFFFLITRPWKSNTERRELPYLYISMLIQHFLSNHNSEKGNEVTLAILLHIESFIPEDRFFSS